MDNSEDRVSLLNFLSSLLGFDDVSDVFDHLLSIDSSEDLLEYMSQLLGDGGKSVQQFVANVTRFKNGERIETNSSAEDKINVFKLNDYDSASEGSKEKRACSKMSMSSQRRSRKTSTKSSLKSKAQQDRLRKEQERKETRREEERNRQRQKAIELEKHSDGLEKKKKQEKELQILKEKEQKRHEELEKSTRALSIRDEDDATEEKEKQPAPRRGKATIVCGCYGIFHKPLTNCLNCGRIACQKEGYGFCAFCGYIIEKVTVKAQEGKGIDKALLHKERLLKFDREFAQRTVVYDDQADYFSNKTSTWLTEDEKVEAEENDRNQRKNLHERKKQTLDICF